jgi:hypothetical protein
MILNFIAYFLFLAVHPRTFFGLKLKAGLSLNYSINLKKGNNYDIVNKRCLGNSLL